ncbi:MAG: hypothetical protein F6K23_06650 [Okeania sp. SIO2C9]|uniref:hypothetical protein n=1 Tax=Okeania sp. SIO2C9 TaxID=2607791 RepID=UPI0013BF5822|nr:hypothetical protein [Okeania sp. SIO2C9]NEQ72777.1 hypothetical protein [Okeania sp. SIO2C9]
MKALYGIEPDLCISNPDILIWNNKDVILPKYFYNQLVYLTEGDFTQATQAAEKIINSLERQEIPNLLIFKTISEGTIYFYNEEINAKPIGDLDTRNPIDRYMLGLINIAEILECQTIFLPLSSEIINKCRALNIDVTNAEEFMTIDTSWLEPEMLVGIEAKLDPLSQVQWEEVQAVEELGNINWVE